MDNALQARIDAILRLKDIYEKKNYTMKLRLNEAGDALVVEVFEKGEEAVAEAVDEGVVPAGDAEAVPVVKAAGEEDTGAVSAGEEDAATGAGAVSAVKAGDAGAVPVTGSNTNTCDEQVRLYRTKLETHYRNLSEGNLFVNSTDKTSNIADNKELIKDWTYLYNNFIVKKGGAPIRKSKFNCNPTDLGEIHKLYFQMRYLGTLTYYYNNDDDDTRYTDKDTDYNILMLNNFPPTIRELGLKGKDIESMIGNPYIFKILIRLYTHDSNERRKNSIANILKKIKTITPKETRAKAIAELIESNYIPKPAIFRLSKPIWEGGTRNSAPHPRRQTRKLRQLR